MSSNTCKMPNERAVYVKLFLYFFFDDYKAMQLRRVPNLDNIKEFKAHIAKTCNISEDFDLRKADGSFLFEDEELTIISPHDILIVVPVFKSTCRSCKKKRKTATASGIEAENDEEQEIVFSPTRHSSVQPDQRKRKKRTSPDKIPRELTHRRINFFEDLNASREENEVTGSKNSSGGGGNVCKIEESSLPTVDASNEEAQVKKEENKKEKKLLIEHYTPAHPSQPNNDFTNTLKVNLISSYVVNLDCKEKNDDGKVENQENDDNSAVSSPKANETTENGSGSNTPDIDGCPKVKRRRIRARKKKKTRDDIVDSPMPAALIPRPVMLSSKPKLHVHFEEAEEGSKEVMETEANEQQLSVDERSLNNSRKIKHLSELRPKDLILFRKHKLLANFCPGISNNIVARVESFYLSGSEDDEIQLTILEGLDEFAQPQGMLTSFDCGDEVVENVQLDAKQTLRWNQLLEPSLLNH